MSQVNSFIERLGSCPLGTAVWSIFEKLCVEILEFLFVPPLTFHGKQVKTYSRTNRRDAFLQIGN